MRHFRKFLRLQKARSQVYTLQTINAEAECKPNASKRNRTNGMKFLQTWMTDLAQPFKRIIDTYLDISRIKVVGETCEMYLFSAHISYGKGKLIYQPRFFSNFFMFHFYTKIELPTNKIRKTRIRGDS